MSGRTWYGGRALRAPLWVRVLSVAFWGVVLGLAFAVFMLWVLTMGASNG